MLALFIVTWHRYIFADKKCNDHFLLITHFRQLSDYLLQLPNWHSSCADYFHIALHAYHAYWLLLFSPIFIYFRSLSILLIYLIFFAIFLKILTFFMYPLATAHAPLGVCAPLVGKHCIKQLSIRCFLILLKLTDMFRLYLGNLIRE